MHIQQSDTHAGTLAKLLSAEIFLMIEDLCSTEAQTKQNKTELGD